MKIIVVRQIQTSLNSESVLIALMCTLKGPIPSVLAVHITS